jgi:hypothetical protein
MILHIKGDQVTAIYDERLDLHRLGETTIRRASHVEPDNTGHWSADLGVSSGPRLGPFAKRSEALFAEQNWLERHLNEL